VAAAFGFTDLSFKQNESYAGNVIQVSDAFALGGITPPVAPYAGTFNGPGPLIGDSPERTVTTIASVASVTSQEQLEGQFYQLRLGPYLEIPMTQHAAICLGGGVAGAVVHASFEFSETASATGMGTFSASGRNSSSDGAVDGYASAQFIWALLRSGRVGGRRTVSIYRAIQPECRRARSGTGLEECDIHYRRARLRFLT
jgi:hypothetical protein